MSGLEDTHSMAPTDNSSDIDELPQQPWELPLNQLRQLYLGPDRAFQTVSVQDEYVPSPLENRGTLSLSSSPSTSSKPLPSGHARKVSGEEPFGNLSFRSREDPDPIPTAGPNRSSSLRSTGSQGIQRRASLRQGATSRSVLSSTAQHRPAWGVAPMVATGSNRSSHQRGISNGSDQVGSERLRLVTYSPSQRAPYLPTRALSLVDQKRVLVTGGAGFVGSHLVDRLMLMGHEVLVVDNFFTGNKVNISHWVGHPNFEVVRHDVVNPLLVEVDQIYHLACPASPKAYQVNPVKTIKTNFQGTLNMLGLAKRTKSRFLLASTSEVYGDPSVHPQPETYFGNVNQTGPRGCYDEGKRIAETLTYGYFYQDGVDVRVARIFNTYGPRMHPFDGRVVSNFILQGLKGEPLTVYGDGQQTRSFMFIHDLVDALIRLMEAEPDTEAPDLTKYDPDQDAEPELGVHGPVNLGNMGEFTIKELVQAVAEAIQHVRIQQGLTPVIPTRIVDDSQSVVPAGPTQDEDGTTREYICGLEIVYCPMPTDDPQKRRPDTTRAKTLLGWQPRWSLKEGLIEMVHYYQQKINAGEL